MTGLIVAAVLQSQIASLTNADRSAQHIAPVTESKELDAAAQKKAEDMLANQYFAHTSPQGITPWYWLLKSGYIYMYAAENLAMDFYDAQSVEAAWMASPTHRANILNSKYKNIGIGIAQGTYQGKPVVFIAEEFGTKQ
jgi:uncharacterized protein YkwD